MTKDEFKKIIKGMKSIYSDPKFIADQDAFDMWYGLLNDLSYEVASMATKTYMQTETFPPSPADIRRYAVQITSPLTEDMSELQAWGLVKKAIGNGNYGAEEEFAKLPPLIQETLGNPARIREMANLDNDEVETVEQSHFVRNYRAKIEAHRKYRQLDGRLQAQIEQQRMQNTPMIEVHEEAVDLIEDKRDEPRATPEEIDTLMEEFRQAVSALI